MNIYAIDKLMSETRHLAAEYHKLTGFALPVSNELARHDAMNILQLDQPSDPESGVDLIGTGPLAGKKIQVKARVIFTGAKSRPKVGQLNFDGKWDVVILVLLDDNYNAAAMYLADRSNLHELNAKAGKALSIGRFKAAAKLIWAQN